MKIKSIVIGTVIGAGVVTGALFGLRTYFRLSQEPVKVAPVMNYYDPYGGVMSDDGHSGTVVTHDSQKVNLDSELVLTKVYVETGDKVKKGDKLLEYDTTLATLQKEMQELNIQILQLNLRTQEKDLATLKSGKLPGSQTVSADTAAQTGSAEIIPEDDQMTGDVPSSDVITSSDGASSDMGDIPIIDDGSSTDITDDGSTDIVIDDSGDDWSDEDIPIIGDDDGGSEGIVVYEDETDESGAVIDPENPENPETEGNTGSSELVAAASDFLSTVELMLTQTDSSILGSYILSALTIYENELAYTNQETFFDDRFLNEEMIVNLYTLSDEVRSDPGFTEDTRNFLRQALAWVLVYDFVNKMNDLTASLPEGTAVSDLDTDQIRTLEQKIRAAVLAYYRYEKNVTDTERDPLMAQAVSELTANFRKEYIDPEFEEGSGLLSRWDLLEILASKLSDANIIVPEETESLEPESEFDPASLGDLGDLGLDDGTTASDTEDLSDEIFAQEMMIRETKLEIREAELKLAQQERKLENSVVKAQVDGVVRQAGTVESGGTDDGFIIISGEQGLYVEATVNELERDSLSIGDIISGQDYNTGATFTCRVTEISSYPVQGDAYSYYGGPAASSYPFYAVIEESDMEIAEGSWVELKFEKNQKSKGFYIYSYLIRTEPDGTSCVYVRGDDNKLQKRIVKTGLSYYGYETEILDGLSLDDYIAFPGKGIKEGAPTKEADSLTDEEW